MKQLKNKTLVVLMAFLLGNNFAFAQQASVSDTVPMTGINTPAAPIQVGSQVPTISSGVNPYNISIPDSFGQIEEVFQGSSDAPLVVHIQNVHANYEAQVNIKNILAHLVNQYQFSLIQLEGAVSKLDPAILQPSYLKEANLKLVDFLMREGKITGADAFAVETDKPVDLYGIEDYSLYTENLKMFKTIYKHQEELKPYFDEVHRLILAVGPKLLRPELLDFTRKTEEFSMDKIDLMDYLTYMNKLSEASKLVSLNDMAQMVDYPNLVRLMRLSKLEEELDRAGLKKETATVKAEFEKKMPDSAEVSEILSHLDDTAKGTSPRTYFLELTKLADQAKIDFAAYPAFRIYAEFLIHQDEIDHRALFSELKAFEQMLQDKLFTTEDEQLYLSIIDHVGLLEQFFRLEMSREKIALYLKARDMIKPSSLFLSIDDLAKKNNIASKPAGGLKNLDSYMSDVEYFYQLVLKRDEVFIDKILTKTKSMSLDKTIIVTGGFHKDGLVDYFRKENISYIVINPKVDVKEGNQNYLKVMLEEDAVAGSVFAGTFALETNNPLNPFEQPRLARDVFGLGNLISQSIAAKGFDVAQANARFAEIAASSGVLFKIESVTEGFTDTFQAKASFFNAEGQPTQLRIVGEADERGIFSVRILEESPANARDLAKVGIVRPQISASQIDNLPELLNAVSVAKNPSRTFTINELVAGLLSNFPLHSIFAPRNFPSQPFTINGDDEDKELLRLRDYFSLLASASKAQLAEIENRAKNGILSLEDIEAIKASFSQRGVPVALEKIDQAPADKRGILNFFNSPNQAAAEKPVVIAFAASDRNEVREAEVRALNQVLTANPNMVALVFGQNMKQSIADILGVSLEEIEKREGIFARLIAVEQDRGVPFSSKAEAVSKLQKSVMNGGIYNLARLAPPTKSMSLEDVLKRLGVFIEANATGTNFGRRLADTHPETLQLSVLSEDDQALAGNNDTAAAVFSAAVRVIAQITGQEPSVIQKKIDDAGLSTAMTNSGTNQWAMVAAAVSVWVEAAQFQHQFETSA